MLKGLAGWSTGHKFDGPIPREINRAHIGLQYGPVVDVGDRGQACVGTQGVARIRRILHQRGMPEASVMGAQRQTTSAGEKFNGAKHAWSFGL